MRNKWYLCNVVYYDGVDAYVSKFVLATLDDKVTEQSEGLVEQYLSGNGEILKIDTLFPVNLDNIVAMRDGTNEQMATYNRFQEMFFVA